MLPLSFFPTFGYSVTVLVADEEGEVGAVVGDLHGFLVDRVALGRVERRLALMDEVRECLIGVRSPDAVAGVVGVQLS
jgi:hypothetical protein